MVCFGAVVNIHNVQPVMQIKITGRRFDFFTAKTTQENHRDNIRYRYCAWLSLGGINLAGYFQRGNTKSVAGKRINAWRHYAISATTPYSAYLITQGL